MNLAQIYDQYRTLLLEGFVPFWLKYGIDWEHGGVLSCMNEDGSPVGGDKFMWSQARSVWTFAALYNRVEKRPEFLKVAENSVRFLLAHGRDDQGRWVYHTDRVGNVIEGATSIYTDCFAVYGLSEYYRAVKDAEILSIVKTTFDRVRRRIEDPDFTETAPYPLPPGWKNHGVPMIMTETAGELAQTTADRELDSQADAYAARVMDHFVRPNRKVLLEFLTDTYEELPPNAGTFVMPGHAIESMWFVLHRAQRRSDQSLARQAAEVIRWHLEKGWDQKYGGIFLGIDADGHEPFLPHADKKLWWPHTEALYALLLAHHLTGEKWCIEWYEKVHEWAFSHFPMPEVGEWRQRLTREGNPTSEVIALPVKDPFHLPRVAILIMHLMKKSIEALR
ncbi:MAG TPA: AGE family epimerase/isomerase [Terriglobia bacterium]|nr:AGE family epimerase/isomerase [Terriglobia bacterium]